MLGAAVAPPYWVLGTEVDTRELEAALFRLPPRLEYPRLEELAPENADLLLLLLLLLLALLLYLCWLVDGLLYLCWPPDELLYLCWVEGLVYCRWPLADPLYLCPPLPLLYLWLATLYPCPAGVGGYCASPSYVTSAWYPLSPRTV